MATRPTSCIYTGTVAHTRHTPTRHRLQYSVYMLFVEIDDTFPALMRDFWGWSSDDSVRSLRLPVPIVGRVSAADYLTRDQVISTLKFPDISRVFVLCNCRSFGFVFNPICIYFAYDASNQLLGAISEVHNTPWGERALYPHDFRDQLGAEELTARWQKEMHVSPFFTLDYAYTLHLTPPASRLCVRLALEDSGGKKPFYASLDLRALPLTQRNLTWMTLRFPLMTFVIVIAIYWHALLLWLKGVKFVPHPKRVTPAQTQAPAPS